MQFCASAWVSAEQEEVPVWWRQQDQEILIDLASQFLLIPHKIVGVCTKNHPALVSTPQFLGPQPSQVCRMCGIQDREGVGLQHLVSRPDLEHREVAGLGIWDSHRGQTDTLLAARISHFQETLRMEPLTHT